MAQLPSERYLVQLIGGEIVLFERGTEREIAKAPVLDHEALGRAQKVIHESELSDEDKSFAHFWFGYFYGCWSVFESGGFL